MVTLITEKLQHQSLDDPARKSYSAGPHSAENLGRSGHLLSLETSRDGRPGRAVSGGPAVRTHEAMDLAFPLPPSPRGPTAGVGVVSARDLRDRSGPPLAPPTKRHCRSLSEPDELACCRSLWHPGGSKVWTLVSKGWSHSCRSGSLPGTTESLGRASPAAGGPSPPIPRSASASGGLSGLPRCPLEPGTLSSRRCLSLSQECLGEVGTVPCTPEPGRPPGLPRSRSQPCVLLGRKSQLKRRREDGARGLRPSLDLLKMTRTLKNSKSLCSLDYEDGEDDTGVKTAVSSPHDLRGLTGLRAPSPRPWASREPRASESQGAGGWDSAGEEARPPLGHGELDLEQIENN